MSFCRTIGAAGLVLGLSHSLFAQSSTCDTVLLQRTLDLAMAQSTERLSWLKLVTEDNFEQIKHDAKADVPEYFSGSWKDFSEKRNTLYKQESFTRNASDSRSVVRSNLPEGAVDAWRACVVGNVTNLVTWIDKVDTAGATIGISWKPAPGLGKLHNPRLVLFGASGADPFSGQTEFTGQTTIVVHRDAADSPIRGAITGTAGTDDASFSSDFFVPVPNSAAAELAALRAAAAACASDAEWQHKYFYASQIPKFKDEIEKWVNSLGPKYGGLQASLAGGDVFHIFARADHADTKWKLTYLTPSADPEWINNIITWSKQRHVQLVGFNLSEPTNLWYFKMEE